MSTKPDVDRFLQGVDPERRESLRKILQGATAGSVIYAAPLVTSTSMGELGGVAHAGVSNQPTAVPATSNWGLAALAGMLAAAGAFLTRNRRDPKS